MAPAEAYEPPMGLFSRVRRLFADPRAAWDRLMLEDASAGAVLGGHVFPLALLMAAAGVLAAFITAGFAFTTATVIIAPASVLIGFILSILAVIGFARLADAFAPRFGAERNGVRAMQLSGYSATAIFIGGLGQLIPVAAPYLLIVGFVYAVALVYFGLPRVMGAPREKRQGYLWSLIGVSIVAGLILLLGFNAAMDGVRAASKHIQIGPAPEAPAPETRVAMLENGVLNAAALRRIGEAKAGGAGAAFNAQRLEGFLPPSLPGGYQRGEVTYASAPGAAQAAAQYQSGAARLDLAVTYLGEAGARAAIDVARDELAPRQDAQGHARSQITDGRLAAESVSGDAIDYVIVGRSVAVSVSGAGGASIDHARAAVETIGMARLEAALPR